MALSQKSSEIEEEPNAAAAAVPENQIKNFDLLTAVSPDHFYLAAANKPQSKNATSDSFLTPSSIAYKKIMKEWRVLEKNLPDSIYVRAYENRIDLLRAAIVGPAGTPYHDGLFFFDISFPSDYPAGPPKVYYRSFGLRINPNLYSTGYVCLSLLNTWYSLRKGEGWNPKESTILQVLVSIQGMVLNREPFFNEPGAGLLPRQRKRSIRYSHSAFILSCKTMMYLVRNPPKGFDDLVLSHFRNRASHILSACNAYITGKSRICEYPAYINGNETKSSSSSSSSSSSCPVKTSRSFKKEVVAIYPRLLTEFTIIAGDSVKSFVEEYKREKKERPSAIKAKQVAAETEGETKKMKKMKKKKKAGFWNKIKGLFGLKKTGEINKKKKN